MRKLARRWWPLVAMIAVALTAQKVLLERRYDVSGHAAEHLSSATVPFAGAAVIAALLYATPRARRQPVVLAAAAAWLASGVLVLIGNLRVVDALVGTGMSDTPTSRFIPTPAIEDAHDLANVAPWLGVLSAVVLAAVLLRYRHVSRRVAVVSTVVSALFPPWMIPGAGVVVLTFARVRAASTRDTATPPLPVASSYT